MSSTFDAFLKLHKTINTYDRAVELFYWDMRTTTPKKGMEGQAEAMTYFSSQSFDLSTSDQMGEYLDALMQPEEYEKLDDAWQFVIRRMKKDYDRNKRIPSDRYAAYVAESAASETAWEEAKRTSNYALFAPHLKKMIDFTKEIASYTDPDSDVYDALLNQYEEGMDSATIDRLFGELKEGLLPLTKQILSAPQPDGLAFSGYFDPDAQRRVQHMLLEYMGFDWDAGACGETEHPFTTNFNSRDVRVTNHYYPHDPLSAIFSAIHEGGHAIFEQNVNPAYDNTAAGSCRSLGIHESQSRFYENILGRNENFWVPVYGKLSHLLPKFQEIPLDDFYRQINHVQNSLIRTESDEVTYCFHVMIRYEIEKAIFRDGISVEELPALWNKKMQEYLHITPPDDAHGILQDMHWSDGSFGYFPTYLLGSIYDGMFLDAMQQQLGSIDEILSCGEIRTITHWLNEKIHRFGSTRTYRETIDIVCGKEVSAEPLLRYFTEKYTQIYHL